MQVGVEFMAVLIREIAEPDACVERDNEYGRITVSKPNRDEKEFTSDKSKAIVEAILKNPIPTTRVEDQYYKYLMEIEGLSEESASAELGRRRRFESLYKIKSVPLSSEESLPAIAASPEPAKRSPGPHAARVLEERGLGNDIPASPTDAPRLPGSWEEAKAMVPGLQRWAEVKRNAGLSDRQKGFDQAVYELLVAHLRNRKTGWGLWANSEAGLPKATLRILDSVLRQQISNLENPEFPKDIKIVNGSAGRPPISADFPTTIPTDPTEEELRAMWRVSRQAEKRRATP